MGAVLVLTTAPDRRTARRLAASLVKGRLAACVSCVDGAESVYRWKGKLEKTSETLLLVKTDSSRLKRLEREIRDNHPYETPEVLWFRCAGGSKKYLRWLKESSL
jgi:periplasmic divalent cation tolerance protein